MRARKIWWAAAGVVFLAVLVLLGGYTWRLQQTNQQLALTLEAERQRNFHALVYHVENLQALLAKGLVTGSARQNLHYMGEVRRHTGAAISHFSCLPLPGPVSAASGKFLAQVGDFAYVVARREAAGQAMTDAERQQLANLYGTAVEVSAALQELALKVAAGGYRWQEPRRPGLAGLLQVPAAGGKPSAEPQSPMSMLPGGVEQISSQMDRLPEFLYDGPFSDHVTRRQPAVTGSPVSREQAADRMRQYLPNAGQWRLTGETEGAGELPTWSFRLVPADGANTGSEVTVDVAKSGGNLVDLINSRPAGEPTLDLRGARDRGLAYLQAAGFTGLEPTYGEVADGFATIQYVHRQGEVLVYPDQVRVKVALDNGDVVGVDATAYLMAHRQRPLPRPGLSPEEAEAALNGELAVEQVQLALIPDEAGTGEILTYEFRALRGDDTFLIYVNAATGEEERILQVIQTENGTFAL